VEERQRAHDSSLVATMHGAHAAGSTRRHCRALPI